MVNHHLLLYFLRILRHLRWTEYCKTAFEHVIVKVTQYMYAAVGYVRLSNVVVHCNIVDRYLSSILALLDKTTYRWGLMAFWWITFSARHGVFHTLYIVDHHGLCTSKSPSFIHTKRVSLRSPKSTKIVGPTPLKAALYRQLYARPIRNLTCKIFALLSEHLHGIPYKNCKCTTTLTSNGLMRQ